MPGFIINGREVQPAGRDGTPIVVVNYRDDSRLALAVEDRRPRGQSWVRNITAHTTLCYRTRVLPGFGPDRGVEVKVASWWRRDGRKAGAHFTIDYDGSVGQHCDLYRDASRNAGALNSYTIGFEIAKRRDPKGGVYQGQIEVAVEVCDWLCRHFGIQRQCVDPKVVTPVPRIRRGGRDVVGVVGHMHQTKHKPNDPGPEFFQALVDAGYMPLTYQRTGPTMEHDDRSWWKFWQAELGVVMDGIPGPATTGALEQAGFADGLVVLPDPR